MAEDLSGLIEKIQQEGVKAAEEKAAAILNQARLDAEAVVRRANEEAKRIIDRANQDTARAEESGRQLLKQAGRDFLLNVRAELNAMLDKLISARVQQALGPPELFKIINALVEGHCGKGQGAGVVISVSRQDLERLEKGFLSGLKEEAQKGVVIKADDNISAGLVISYDAGKSHFDFSAQALTEYISAQLKPQLGEILKG